MSANSFQSRPFGAMFNQNNIFTMNNIILRYGLFSGVLSALLVVGTGFYLQKNGVAGSSEVWGYAGMVISMIFIFVGVRVYRDQERGGVISFGEALKVGGLMALISCVCYSVAWMAVSEWILPDFMDQYIQFILDKMKTEQKPEAEIQKAAADMASFKEIYANPLYKFLLTLREPLPVALVVTLASAGLLKKKGKI